MKLTMLWLTLAVVVAAPISAGERRVDMGPEAEISFDGLYRVQRSVADSAWVAPQLDLSAYRKLLVRSAGVAFRSVDWSGSASAAVRRGETEFPVTEQNRQTIAELLHEELLDELDKSERYVLTDAPGPDVLLVTAGLFDVVSNVPPEGAGRGRTYLRTIGAATLVVELRDSMTGAILARAVDRRSADSVTLHESSPVRNRAEVRRLVDTWGRTIRDALDTVIRVSDGGALVSEDG